MQRKHCSRCNKDLGYFKAHKKDSKGKIICYHCYYALQNERVNAITKKERDKILPQGALTLFKVLTYAIGFLAFIIMMSLINSNNNITLAVKTAAILFEVLTIFLWGFYAYNYGLGLKLSKRGLGLEPISKFQFWITVTVGILVAILVLII